MLALIERSRSIWPMALQLTKSTWVDTFSVRMIVALILTNNQAFLSMGVHLKTRLESVNLIMVYEHLFFPSLLRPDLLT